MVLGLTTVKCMALSAALFDPKKISSQIEIDIKGIYGNIISVATTCRKLAIACRFSSPEDAFTCGLLHDIGSLYFMHHCPLEFKTVIMKAARTGNLIDEEKKIFGISHPEVGRIIGQKWHLPANMLSAISNHENCGSGNASQLDDIIRLAVALNREAVGITDQYIEDKITKIGVISKRLNLTEDQLNQISSTIMNEALEFAALIEIDIGSYESILTRANQEVFNTYMSIHKLFKERQELTSRILEEERERGLLEAKQIAVSTLSHYINNASMQISGQSQILRLFLTKKKPEEIVASMPRLLDTIDEAVRKTVAVLEEISELNMLDDVEYFDKSKVMNIDKRIKDRLAKLVKHPHGVILPKEAEKAVE
jgi:HD superfamily phosphohydrolase YqeK